MELDLKQISQFEDALLNAKKILLLTHRNPDGDAIGSLLALFQILRKADREVTPACFDPAPASLKFLPESKQILNDFNTSEFDLIVVLDCGDLHQTGFHESKPELFDGSRVVVKIDHHPSAPNFGTVNLVNSEFCATSAILTELFEFLEIPISPDVATCLLTGISTDTGSFRHSNTRPETFRLAAKLLRKGANNFALTKNVYRTTSLPALKLWGQVLQNLQQTDDRVTLAVAQKKDFESTITGAADLAGVVDLVNAVPNAKFSILLSERNNLVKASLRTLDDEIDVSAIARKFGGGGHVKAAGFAVPGRLEKEVRWSIKPPEDPENEN